MGGVERGNDDDDMTTMGFSIGVSLFSLSAFGQHPPTSITYLCDYRHHPHRRKPFGLELSHHGTSPVPGLLQPRLHGASLRGIAGTLGGGGGPEVGVAHRRPGVLEAKALNRSAISGPFLGPRGTVGCFTRWSLTWPVSPGSPNCA